MEQLGEDTVYPIGVSGVLTEVNDQGYVRIRLDHRVHLDHIFAADGKISLDTSRLPGIDDLNRVDAENRLNAVKTGFQEITKAFDTNLILKSNIQSTFLR